MDVLCTDMSLKVSSRSSDVERVTGSTNLATDIQCHPPRRREQGAYN